MDAWTLQHVSIWLDDASSNEAAFSHALEWAFRLHLPLRVIAIAQPPVTDRIKTWGETAALRGVTLEAHLTAEKTRCAVDQFLRTNGLCVFSSTATTQTEQDLMRQSSQTPKICQMFCASGFAPISRVLVVCRDADLRAGYLESVARLCHALETTPIVLILAGSEYDAELKQEYAEGIFHSRRMAADVDFVVDRNEIQAINRVMSWRRCSHVIAPRSSEATGQRLRDLSASVSVLTVPDGVSLKMPHLIRSSRDVLPWNRSEPGQPVVATEHV